MAATSIHPIHTTEIKSIRYVMRDDKTDNGANIITYACGKTPEAIEKVHLAMLPSSSGYDWSRI